jgi:hypothetical protein
MHLYKIKQVVKRITVEGEHLCLLLLKQDQRHGFVKEPLCLEVIPIMNAPYQRQTIQIPLESIEMAHIYRYLFQYKSVRIVT